MEEAKENDTSPRAAPGSQGILTGEEIQQLGLIDPLDRDPKYLKATSYDLTLGSEVYVCGQGEAKLIKLGNGTDTVPIDSFGTIIFSTKEKIRLGKYTNIVGHFGLRIQYGLKGFILQVGPQIEPGYDGPLFGALLNTRNRRQFIPRGTRFLTAEFYRSQTPASVGSSGKFRPKTINTLREFLEAQGIEDDGLVLPSLVKQIEKDFDDCREKHGIKSAKEDRMIAEKGILWKKIAVVITIVIAVVGWVLLFLNWYLKDHNSGKNLNKDSLSGNVQQSDNTLLNRQGPSSADGIPVGPQGLGRENKKDSGPNIEGVKNEPVLSGKTAHETKGIGIDRNKVSDPNAGIILKDDNEP